MTRYRYFLLSSVLQFPYSFNVQQYQFFFAPKPSALPPLCPPPYIENPAIAHELCTCIKYAGTASKHVYACPLATLSGKAQLSYTTRACYGEVGRMD